MNPSKVIRLIALSAIFCFIISSINAQINKRDIVYLKNGSIIKGYILEMIPNGTIKIRTTDGSIFIYKMDEVDKTSKEASEVAVKSADSAQATKGDEQKSEEAFMTRGYILIVRGGPNLHVGENDPTIDASLGIINAVQVNEYLSIGVGIEGTSYAYDQTGANTALIFPIFFDTRFYVPRQRVQPMFGFQFGYSFVNNKNAPTDPYNANVYNDFVPKKGKGGTYMAVNAGMRILINNRTSIIADGGFSFQQLKNGYSPNNGFNAVETIPSLRINFGLCINLSPIKNKTRTSQ
jgi:hypothetical protein